MNSITGYIFASIILTWSLTFADTPEKMLDNVSKLSEASAILNICFESDEFDDVLTERALKMFALETRIYDLIENIAEYYNDEFLVLSYEFSKVKMSSDAWLIEYAQNEYQYCGGSLLEDIKVYVSENEDIINDFISRKKAERMKRDAN